MEESEMVIFDCDECEGHGWVSEYVDIYSMKCLYKCEKCEGRGRVDWARFPMNFADV